MSNTENTTPKSKKPIFDVLVVHESGTPPKATWYSIGKAWAGDKGDGFNIELAATPIGNRLYLRTMKSKNSAENADQKDAN